MFIVTEQFKIMNKRDYVGSNDFIYEAISKLDQLINFQ